MIHVVMKVHENLNAAIFMHNWSPEPALEQIILPCAHHGLRAIGRP